MYRAGSTDIPGMSRRTFRVSGLGRGLGVYTPNEFVAPTYSDGVMQRAQYSFVKSGLSFREGAQSVNNQISAGFAPPPAKGVSGLGDSLLDTSNPLFWIAAAAAGFWLWKKYG